jgi:hypothetical protein
MRRCSSVGLPWAYAFTAILTSAKAMELPQPVKEVKQQVKLADISNTIAFDLPLS